MIVAPPSRSCTFPGAGWIGRFVAVDIPAESSPVQVKIASQVLSRRGGGREIRRRTNPPPLPLGPSRENLPVLRDHSRVRCRGGGRDAIPAGSDDPEEDFSAGVDHARACRAGWEPGRAAAAHRIGATPPVDEPVGGTIGSCPP